MSSLFPFRQRVFLPLLTSAGLAMAISCGGGGGGGTTTPPPPPVSVTVGPLTANIAVGATQTFLATVTNATNTAVTWSVQEGASGGGINAGGVYTAPSIIQGSTATFHVVATSVADTTKSGMATVTVSQPLSIGITPGQVNLSTGGSQQFNATVNSAASTAVAWSVQEGASGGTISAAGLYTAPSTISGASAIFHVVVTSTADTTKSATSTVTVTPLLPPAHSMVLLAGDLGGLGNADGPTTLARFNNPFAAAMDPAGNIFVSDLNNYRIRVISPGGMVSSLAWTVSSGVIPRGIVFDPAGNLYFMDQAHHVIWKAPPGGQGTLFAGSGSYGTADGPPGVGQTSGQEGGLARDAAGNLYLADTFANTIRKISPTGVLSTLAGNPGHPGSADGTGSAALFQNPWAVATDAGGTVYVADSGNDTIRVVSPSGVVTTLAGSAGQEGTADGSGAAARFNGPLGITVDTSGNLYVADSKNHTIRRITPSGLVSTLAGSPGQAGGSDGSGAAARFNTPDNLSLDTAGNILVADYFNHAIRRVTPAGAVSTLAGTAPQSGSTDAIGSAARFQTPKGVAVDASGNAYLADSSNQTLRKITSAGVVTTLAGSPGVMGSSDGAGSTASFQDPYGIAVDAAGNLYVADQYNSTIRKITPEGVVSTLAGSADHTGSADGNGSTARFKYPTGLCVDGAGNVFVADFGNSTIRKITPGGDVTTVAGSPGQGGYLDGTGSAARFNTPTSLTVDSSGNLYVADTKNLVIRKVTSAGVVSTLAGEHGQWGSVDGTGAAARFGTLTGIAMDSQGDLWVTDTANHTLRKVTQAGVVTTVAGIPGQGTVQLGTLPGLLVYPLGVAAAPDGRILVTLSNGVIALLP